MVRLCSLAEPSSPAQVPRAYRYLMSPVEEFFSNLLR
jgi:hypothetical protein